MSAAEVLEKVRALAATRALHVARTAVWTGDRPISFDDMRNALVYAVGCSASDVGGHIVVGVDLDSEVLRLQVEVGDVVRVLTARRETSR